MGDTKVKALAVLVLASALVAGCSGTSGGGSTNNAAASGSSTSASGPASGSSPSGPASGSGDPSSSAGSACSAGSAKPVAEMLAKAKPEPVLWDSNAVPKACPQWVSALQLTDAHGKSLYADESASVNLLALIDEAAKTNDLDSLLKLCSASGECSQGQIEPLLKATDASGHTGYQQLSEVLEKTHADAGNCQESCMAFPGFASGVPGATVTALEQQDMKQLGVASAKAYSGIAIQLDHNDGPAGGVQWTGFITPQGIR